jgi:uncharacterized membrane protein
MELTEAAVVICLCVCVMLVLMELLSVMRDKLTNRPTDAEAILAERYAKGEIDEDEYSDRLSSLRLGPPLQIK